MPGIFSNPALVLPGSITDTEISASAAIAKSKLAPLDIVNADVNAAAAIVQSKIVDAVNADIAAGAAIVQSKIVQPTGTGIPHIVAAVPNTVASLIVNADVDAAAGIAPTKILNTAAVLGAANVFGAHNQTFDTDVLFVDAVNNRVGIGKITPLTKQHVSEGITTDVEVARFDSNGGSGSIQGKTYIGLHHWSSGTYPSVRIGVEEDGITSYDAALVFQTRNSGSEVVPSTKMTLNKVGNLGIANITPPELLTLGTPGTKAGVLSLAGATSGKAIIVVPAVAGTPTLTLPTSTGTIAREIPGAVSMYAGATVPTGYLFCDGAVISRSTYAALFTAISTAWGAGDGSTTFAIPDMRGRAPIGVGTGTGLTARALAALTGVETHALTTAELAVHGHSGSSGGVSADHSHSGTSSGQSATHEHGLVLAVVGYATGGIDGTQRVGGGSLSSGAASADHSHTLTTGGMSVDHTHAISVANAGSGTAHPNMQPSAAINFIIKT